MQPRRLAEIAHWGFADFVLAQHYDVASRTTKLRRACFADFLDSEEMVLDHLARYRDARPLP